MYPKRVIEMARKWQRVAALGRRSRSLQRAQSTGAYNSDACSSVVADKGHFIVYSSEGERFMVPLKYLRSSVFRELFRMAEDEFGLPVDGPITLPCDAVFIEYVVSLLKGGVSEAVERALLSFVFVGFSSSSSLLPEGCNQQLVVCGS